MSTTRQLAAIMFTDIVGYTALMGNDEQKAFAILNKNRALQKPIIEQFNGRWHVLQCGTGTSHKREFRNAWLYRVHCCIERKIV